MIQTGAATSSYEVAAHYTAKIESHRNRLLKGHDPLGHLFAIERLARAARSESWAARRDSEQPAQ